MSRVDAVDGNLVFLWLQPCTNANLIFLSPAIKAIENVLVDHIHENDNANMRKDKLYWFFP